MRESANRKSANRQSSSSEHTTTEQILDLLLDALSERQAARQSRSEVPLELDEGRSRRAQPKPVATPSPAPEPIAEKPAVPTRESQPDEESRTPPPPLPSINLGRTLGHLVLALIALVVVINVPITRYGASLARIMPDSASLVIRDGLVLKGSGTDIYVLEDDKLRWISCLDAFEFFGYRWDQVHIRDDSFLEQFEKGRPIHVLLKCEGSPHIYALQDGEKRWIKDTSTFDTEGYVWEDIKFVSCDYLRNLPDGPPIPEDAGPPPQP